MRGAGTGKRGWGVLERGTAAALLLAAAAALAVAARLAAAAAGGDELAALLRERTERRLADEREQLRALTASPGARPDAAALAAARERFPENSQLRLALAAALRERDDAAAALREYRRAIELVRDYADRRSPHALGADLGPWLRRVRPGLTGAPLADLRYLERALAGGCA